MAKSRTLSTPLLIVLIGGLLVFLSSGIRAAQDYAMTRFSVRDIGARIQKVLWDGIVLRLTMNIQNESGVAIPIESFNGILKYGREVLAPIQLTNPTTVQSGQVTSVQFDVPVSFAELTEQIVNLINSKQFIQDLTVEGVVTAGGINVPFTQNLVAFG